MTNLEKLREEIARALCEADGYDPDHLEPGDDPYQGEPGWPSPCIDGYNRKDEPCYFFWRHYDRKYADAILENPTIKTALRFTDLHRSAGVVVGDPKLSSPE
jgi:hypothetical protein